MVHLAADGLFESLLTGQPPERLGDCWLRVQQNLAKGPINPLTFRLLDAVDGDNRIPEATQRLEHLEMFVLLGDPALKLPTLASDLPLQADGQAVPGEVLTVTGAAPDRLEGARVRLVAERPLGSLPEDLQPLPAQPSERDRVMRANHERANRFAVATAEATVRDGRFVVQLRLPDRLFWPRLRLRAYAATDRADGLGLLTVDVKP
jgi:hypothetical protein